MKTHASIVSVLLAGLSVLQSNAQGTVVEVAVPTADPVMVDVATVGETNALVGAINKHRTDLGIPPLVVDAALSAAAASAFPEVLNAAGEVNVTALKKDFDALDVGVLRGVLTHRREESGAEFPTYWAKDPQWNAVMNGGFTHMGAATVKRSDGKLVAFVYLIKR